MHRTGQEPFECPDRPKSKTKLGQLTVQVPVREGRANLTMIRKSVSGGDVRYSLVLIPAPRNQSLCRRLRQLGESINVIVTMNE